LLFGLIARLALAPEQSFPLLGGLVFRRDVAADADHPIAVVVGEDAAPLPDPDDGAVAAHRAVLRLVRAGAQCHRGRIVDQRPIVGMHGATNPQVLAERALRETEKHFGIGRPPHLPGCQMPFPGADLRHLERHPETLLVFSNPLMGAIERRCALSRSATSSWSLSLSSARARVLRKTSTKTPILDRRISALTGLLR